MDSQIYDVIIIGAGAAGLTAAIYTSRENLNTLLLDKAQTGGLTATTELVENYPGFPENINGMALMGKFAEQAKRFGSNIAEFKEVESVKPEGKRIKVRTSKEEYQAYSVIVASGSVPKRLDVPGEETFKGKGVSYCATCDGPLFRDKDVAVIGCGNSGLQEGEALLKYVKSVSFIEFLPEMTATKILQERLRKEQKAGFLLNHALTAINGKQVVESVTVKDRESGSEKQISLSGVFIYAGFLPNSKFLEGIVQLDESGYIKTDADMATSVSGIYAAGDIRAKKVRQIDTACAEGTIAAISVRDYIKEVKA
jgi:thioredoxin reductase (NADPH)